MHEIDNKTFECFVTKISTIMIIDHKAYVIMK